jgi:hypothetical protein
MKFSSWSKDLILKINLTKNNPTERVSILTEGKKRFWELSIHLTSLEKTT